MSVGSVLPGHLRAAWNPARISRQGDGALLKRAGVIKTGLIIGCTTECTGEKRCDPGLCLKLPSLIMQLCVCVHALVFMQTLRVTVNSDCRRLDVD